MRKGWAEVGPRRLAAAITIFLTGCSGTATGGDVSRTDFVASVEQRFVALDSNGDLHLSASEMRDAAPMAPGFDRDGDGSVSRAEFVAGRAKSFDRSDRNGDGVVTRAERRANQEAWKRLERGGMPARTGSSTAP